MAAIVDLPHDVFFLILDHLVRDGDLNALCQTSRDIYRLANPCLYRRVTRSGLSSCQVTSWAAQHDRVGTLEKLFAAGANPLSCGANWDAPIIAAAKHGSVGVTKLLFETEGVDPERGSPIDIAASHGQVEVLKLYLANPRVSPARKDEVGVSTLEHAAGKRQPRTVELLLGDERVDPSATNWEGSTALVHAADSWEDNTEVLRLLLSDPRVDVNHFLRDGRTALHMASSQGNVENVRLLLDAGADGRVLKNRDDVFITCDTALISNVSFVGNITILEMLLAVPGIDPNATTFEGQTALMMVTDLCHKICDNTMVTLLLNDKRVDPNIMDDEGRTALTISASYGNLENVRNLLAWDGIDVNLGAEQQQFVLHNAIKSRDLATVELLLADERLNILTRDEKGWTPFLVAVHSSSVKIIRLLLEDGRCAFDGEVEDSVDGEVQDTINFHNEVEHNFPNVADELFIGEIEEPFDDDDEDTVDGEVEDANRLAGEAIDGEIEEAFDNVVEEILDDEVQEASDSEVEEIFDAVIQEASDSEVDVISDNEVQEDSDSEVEEISDDEIQEASDNDIEEPLNGEVGETFDGGDGETFGSEEDEEPLPDILGGTFPYDVEETFVEVRGSAWSLAQQRAENAGDDVMELLVRFRHKFPEDTDVPNFTTYSLGI